VPGGGRGRVPQVKLSISIPSVLAERIEDRIRRDGSATSVADFLRQAAVKVLDLQDAAPRRSELMVPITKAPRERADGK
jgi:Arc/MetJ-type ribon-helix-helix transcriptional regulator